MWSPRLLLLLPPKPLRRHHEEEQTFTRSTAAEHSSKIPTLTASEMMRILSENRPYSNETRSAIRSKLAMDSSNSSSSAAAILTACLPFVRQSNKLAELIVRSRHSSGEGGEGLSCWLICCILSKPASQADDPAMASHATHDVWLAAAAAQTVATHLLGWLAGNEYCCCVQQSIRHSLNLFVRAFFRRINHWEET